MSFIDRAEEMTAKTMELIEAERLRKNVSMRKLSAAAGLRPTSYWEIRQRPESVRAVTLFALNEAVRSFPG